MLGQAGMGEWCRMGLDDAFQIGQVLAVGPAQVGFCSWARWAWCFTVKKIYMTSYNIPTHNITSFMFLRLGEWVDGC